MNHRDDPLRNPPVPGHPLSSRGLRLLRVLAREAASQSWTLLDADHVAGELGVRNSELLVLLHELETARLIERWPLGSLVYLTPAGRALEAQLDSDAA